MRLTDDECRSLAHSTDADPLLALELVARVRDALAALDPLELLPPVEQLAAEHLQRRRDEAAAILEAERYPLDQMECA